MVSSINGATHNVHSVTQRASRYFILREFYVFDWRAISALAILIRPFPYVANREYKPERMQRHRGWQVWKSEEDSKIGEKRLNRNQRIPHRSSLVFVFHPCWFNSPWNNCWLNTGYLAYLFYLAQPGLGQISWSFVWRLNTYCRKSRRWPLPWGNAKCNV